MIHLFKIPSDKKVPMTLSVFLRKTFASQKSRVSQAGQAVVEYILVLVVTVSIIMGILYQFNDAFKNFLDSYFGDYIACLLETGELPSLGGDGPTQGECNAGFANFSIASGRPAKGHSDSSSGSSDGSSSEGDSSSSSGSSSSKGSRPSRFSSSRGTSNSEASANPSGNSRPGRQVVRNNQSLGDAQGLESNSSESTSGGGRRRIVRRKVIYLGDDYLTEDAKKKKDRLVTQGKKSKKSRKMGDLRKARFPLVVPEPKRSLAQEDGSGFSFAFFIKFLMVAGIVIALFIFLGGQAMQIKKSWQKSE